MPFISSGTVAVTETIEGMMAHSRMTLLRVGSVKQDSLPTPPLV
jgi:hypothetical protein